MYSWIAFRLPEFYNEYNQDYMVGLPSGTCFASAAETIETAQQGKKEHEGQHGYYDDPNIPRN